MDRLLVSECDSNEAISVQAGNRNYLLVEINPQTGEAQCLFDNLDQTEFKKICIAQPEGGSEGPAIAIGEPMRLLILPDTAHAAVRERMTADVTSIDRFMIEVAD